MKLWIWEWENGGYNSCRANTREEALTKARAITSALKMNEKSLHEGTTEELLALDRRFASLCW